MGPRGKEVAGVLRGPRLPSPCSLCAVRVTGDHRPGPLSVQVMLEPEAHSDLGRARRLLWLQEPFMCQVGLSSTAPAWGCPFTSQEKRASCRASPMARQVNSALSESQRPCGGGGSRRTLGAWVWF